MVIIEVYKDGRVTNSATFESEQDALNWANYHNFEHYKINYILEPEQEEERIEEVWKRIRKKRDYLLKQTDKTQLADFPIDSKVRLQFREYRQYLRDLPKLYNDISIRTAKVKEFEQWLEWKRSGQY